MLALIQTPFAQNRPNSDLGNSFFHFEG